jgi:hypothetical protein
MSERDRTWAMINEVFRAKKREALQNPEADVVGIHNNEKLLRKRLKDAKTGPEISKEENSFNIAVKSAVEMIDDLPVIGALQDADEVEDTISIVVQKVLGENCDGDKLQKLIERVKEAQEIKEAIKRFDAKIKKSHKDTLRHSLEAYLETKVTARDVNLQDAYERKEYEYFVRQICEKHEISNEVCAAFLTENLPERMIELAKELLLEPIVNRQMKEYIEKLLAKPNIEEFTRFYSQNDTLIDIAIPIEKMNLFLFIIDNLLIKLLDEILKPSEKEPSPDDIKLKAGMLGFYIKKFGKVDRSVYMGIDEVLE